MIIASQLQLLSELGDREKLYVINNTHLEKEPTYYLQSVTRKLWNAWYGGANRVDVLKFLEHLHQAATEDVEEKIARLKEPYVQENYRAFGVMSNPNRTQLESIKEMKTLLIDATNGLQKLQKTYIADTNTLTRLCTLSTEYYNLASMIEDFVKTCS